MIQRSSKKYTGRIPLPEKTEQVIKGKKDIYSRKMKHKKDWRFIGNDE